jgi:hypothetical protein
MTDPIKRGGGAGPVDPSAAEGASGTTGPRTEEFRETLGASSQASGTSGAQAPGELGQLASELREGRLTPEQVIEALVARQLRSHAAQMLQPAQRAELETLLRSRLEEDPTLLALGRDLTRGR